MKLGILFGPSSGSGQAVRAETILSEKLEGCQVAVCKGIFGGNRPSPAWTTLNPLPAGGYVDGLRAAVGALGAWGADILVCVGGDGLASYAADAMLSGTRSMILLGIAAGTANVGPIVSAGLEELAALDPNRLPIERIGAVEVLVDGDHLAYGFNDIVIGNTFLGTLEGGTVNLSVAAMLERGAREAAEPSSHITESSFVVRKNGREIAQRMKRPAQIIASPLGRREFYGRAISGVLCNAAYMRGAAALAMFDSIIVRPGNPVHGISDFSVAEQLLFDKDDTVEIGGLTADGQIVADGNPHIRSGDSIGFKSIPDLVDVARIL